MARKEEKLYTTGEVAKLFDIKKDTLFYYDRINLFSPNYRKGNTSYRYYGNKQLPLLDTILVLRELDIPISTLKSYISNMNAESFLSLIALESEKIETKIADLKTKSIMIQELAKKMKTAICASYETLFITESKENKYYISSPIIKKGKDEDEAWYNSQDILLNSYPSNKIVTFGSVLPLDKFRDCKYSDISQITAYTIDKTDLFHEKGLYAKMYIKGNYDALPDKYPAFKEEIEKSGYEITSDVYEEYIITSLSEKHEDEFVTLLSARVAKCR